MTSTIGVRPVVTAGPAEVAAPPSAPLSSHAGRSDVETYWDAHAASFDARDPTAIGRLPDLRGEWKAVLRDVLGEGPLFALDAGCGTGDVAGLLSELGHVVSAVDCSTRMVEQTRDKCRCRGAHVDVRRGYAEALPFASSSFDVVIARNVLWDLASPELAVRDWMRVLRPGGRVVVIESRWLPTPPGPVHRALTALGLAGDGVVPPVSRPFPRPARPDRAVEFLRAMGLEHAMFLDLAWLRRRDCETLPRLRRCLSHPEGRHYAVWASKI